MYMLCISRQPFLPKYFYRSLCNDTNRRQAAAKYKLDYLQQASKLKQEYFGQYVAFMDGQVVLNAPNEVELIKKLREWRKEHPDEYPLLSRVGFEGIPGMSEMLPIDIHMLTTGDSSSLTYESIAHPQEYKKVTENFKPEGRFQSLPNWFSRPVCSIPVSSPSPRIVSFILDTGSPWSFVSSRTIAALGLTDPLADIWGWEVYTTFFLGKDRIVRKSDMYFKDINLIGVDNLSSFHLHVHKDKGLVRLEE